MKNSRDIKLLFKRLKKMNNFLVLNALLIVCISISTIYSATISRTSSFYIKESIWTVIGLIAYLVVTMIDYKKYLKYYKVLYLLNILMLLSVFALGVSRLGAQRWIDLGPVSIQPSEVGKVLVVITLSAFLSTHFKDRLVGIKSVIIAVAHIAPVLLLILKQPDLGTTLIILMTFSVIIFMYELDWKTIIILGLSGVDFVPFAYFFLL